MGQPSAVQRKSLEQATMQYGANIEMAEEYLANRGIELGVARSVGLGVVTNPLPGHESRVGRLAIPYLTNHGPVNMNFRCMLDHKCKDHGHQKYMTWSGLETNMYGVQALRNADDWIAISEGEIDAISARLSGVPCVGVSGASKWLDHWNLMLEDFTHVYVFQDGDEAGVKFADKVLSQIPGAIRVVLPPGEDVNSILVAGSAAAVRELIRK